jgi:hypothetical protein
MQILNAQLGIARPLAYGRVRAKGNQIILTQLADRSRVSFYLLGEGKWSSPERLWVNRKRVDWTDVTQFHFHPGDDGVIGGGLAATSIGNDQFADEFFTLLPANIQPLTFSRMAYLAVHVAEDPGAPTSDLEVVGDYQALEVRTFNAAGVQTGFSWTTNPAWCILDLLLRKKIKPEGLINEALTAAEKTRIGFQSFSDAADYYAASGGGSAHRFELNVAFPSQANFTTMMEQMLLMCRSYIVEEGGVIYLFPDKDRASTFVLTSDHYIPGTLQPDESLAENAANHIVGTFNDLNVPIVASVGGGGASRTSGVTTLTCTVDHPFLVGDTVNIPKMDDATFLGSFEITAIPTSTQLEFNQVGQPDAVSGHGIVGIDEERFVQRAPMYEHLQHQLAVGQRGVGLATTPLQIPLSLDYGNNTVECVKRLMAYQAYRYLGADTTPWKAPFKLVLQAWMESVDVNGNTLIEQLRGDLITIDSSVSEDFGGDYELLEVRLQPACGMADGQGSGSGSSYPNDSGIAELTLLGYVPDAFIDFFASTTWGDDPTATVSGLFSLPVFRPP